jgi:hypothetical protein
LTQCKLYVIVIMFPKHDHMKTKVLTPSHEAGHRAPERTGISRALRATRFLLGHGHAPRHTAGERHDTGRRHAAPARHETNPSPSTLRFASAHTEHLKGKDTALAVTVHRPLLYKEQVRRQLGFEIGSLQAIIHLPAANKPLYCFNQSYVNAQGDKVARFALATPDQLGMLRSMIETGYPTWDEIQEGMLYLNRDPSGETPDYSRQTIGKARWLPDRTNGGSVLQEYRRVADRQVTLSIDDYGGLYIRDQDTAAGTRVEFNPELIHAQDPWAGAPLQPDWHVSNLRT